MLKAFYNEIDRFCCDWLQNLMDRGHITPGKIDDRSITELTAADVRGYERVHFFAGIAGWELAASLAGWGDRPLWTGSCPCQPFSAAGKQRGHEDERHLWPAFFRLIRECRPPVVVGEQVAGAAGLAWLDHVLADLEGEGYAAAAADLPACGVGAPHRRQRLWWVAYADRGRQQQRDEGQRSIPELDENGRERMGDAEVTGLEGRDASRGWAQFAGPEQASPWRDLEWLPCADGKARPTESIIQQVFDGLPAELGYRRDGDQYVLSPLIQGTKNRTGRLRAYGNAIVPQVAAEFLAAVMECRP